MADYSDAYAHQCGKCGGWNGHTPNCTSEGEIQRRYRVKMKELGFIPADSAPHYNPSYKTTSWNCLRGCGTVVHDPETHMKNVCKDYSG